MLTSGARWSAEQADEMAGLAARAAGLSDARRLVRYGTNAIFELKDDRLALRLTPPGTRVTEVETQVAFASWANARDTRINAPAPIPVIREGLEGGVASFWEWLETDGDRAGPQPYAQALRLFHDVARDCPIELPRWSPFGRLEDRWTSDEVRAEIGDERATDLRTRSESLSHSPLLWQNLQVIHGDAHAGNLLHEGDRWIWTDFDLIARGPALDDLASYGLAVRRFGNGQHELETVLDTYGATPAQRAQLELVTSVKELLSLAWLSTILTRPGARPEFHRRAASIVEETSYLWQAF